MRLESRLLHSFPIDGVFFRLLVRSAIMLSANVDLGLRGSGVRLGR